MEDNNKRETNELSFGDSKPTNESPVSTKVPQPSENKQETPSQNNERDVLSGGNSFYDRQQDKAPSVAWYKDWRGKTLGLTLAALILIGGGIPAGMAIGGYWKTSEFDGLVDNTDVETIYDIAENEVERIYNIALREHYDNMVYEGYFTKSAHDKKIEDSEEAADDSIDNKKEELKANYGNTWEEEYDDFLKESGFHTSANGGEDEWKADMIAADIESDVKSQYTSKGAITSVIVENDPVLADAHYVSETKDSRSKKYYVENQTPAYYNSDDNTNPWGDEVEDEDGNTYVVPYSYTPEDLVDMYLLTYEPIVFNNTLLPFIPVKGANDTTADLQGNNIYMTNEDVMDAWILSRADGLDTGKVGAVNYGGIQSKNKVDFTSQGLGQEANIVVNYAMASYDKLSTNLLVPTTPPFTINDIVSTAFTDAGVDASTVDSEEIGGMDSQAVQDFSKSLATSLKTSGILTNGGAKRTIAYTGVYNNDPLETGTPSNNTVTFLSSNGLNNIGVSFEGKSIVIEQLDNYVASRDALDLGFISSFNSWYETAFKNITIFDYLFTWENASIDTAASNWFTGLDGVDPEADGANYQNVGSVLDDEDVRAILDESEDYEVTDGDRDLAQRQVQAGFLFTLLKDVSVAEKNNIATAYTSAKSFYKTNWEDYDINEFNTKVGLDIITYKSSSNLNVISTLFFDEIGTATYKTNNEVILNKGGNQ